MTKTTALYESHQQLKAKMVDFAGYQMPIWYQSAKEEHLSVRNNVGMFDISHMGMVVFNADDASEFLQRVCTNDLNKTANNKIVYTMILNQQGGILDDVMVGYNPQWDRYFMIINAANKNKIMSWFKENGLDLNSVDVRFDSHGLIAVQGPKAMATIQSLFSVNWDQLGRFQSQVFEYNGQEAIMMRTGYTGEDGVEISVSNQLLPYVWQALLSKGVVPCGLASRDSLRIESGLPLYGHELSEDITPLDTRYQWVLKWDVGFIGLEALSLKKESIDNHTVGLIFKDRCLPRQGYIVQEGGFITSGSFSPILNQPIAIAMVPAHIQMGQDVSVMIRNKAVLATVVSLPFVTH